VQGDRNMKSSRMAWRPWKTWIPTLAAFWILVATGDVCAVILPNPDPSAPTFTEGWWLQMLVLAVFSVAFGFMIVLFGRWLKRQDDADTKQDVRIEHLDQSFHECQVRCASSRGEYVRREDFEGRMLRMEDMMVRIHERVDAIAINMGLPDDARRIG
jgi:hypothetical protein